MAITQERMLRLIAAASAVNECLQGLDRAMATWEAAIARGEITYEQAYRNIRPWLYNMGPRPTDLAAIEIEETHFAKQKGNLYRARERMTAAREGAPPAAGRRPRRSGYTTAPHDPTGRDIAAVAQVFPQSSMVPRNTAELEAHIVEANRIMAADMAELAKRESFKPKPLPFAPPRAAPMNPYENDGLPDIVPEPPEGELTPEEPRARVAESKAEPTP